MTKPTKAKKTHNESHSRTISYCSVCGHEGRYCITEGCGYKTCSGKNAKKPKTQKVLADGLYAIIDKQEPRDRLCYATKTKKNGAMAVYDKKPTIEPKWRKIKKVVDVILVIPAPVGRKK